MSGSENAIVGNNAMSGTTENISECVAIGINALSINRMDQQVAIGANALSSNDTGFENLAIGYNALLSNTSGVSNLAIGHYALSDIEGACANNIGIGYAAMTVLQDTAADNIAIGRLAGNIISIGTDNTIVGSRSALVVTTGSDNCVIGSQSCVLLDTGSNNVAIGDKCSIDAGGLRNVLLGSGASSGAFNDTIVLGHDAEALGDGHIAYGSNVAFNTDTVPTGALVGSIPVSIGSVVYYMGLYGADT